jgi:hypothetical protein
MAILGIVNKQPTEVLDFDINYAPVLLGRSDSLAFALGTATPAGLTIVNTIVNPDTMTTQVVVGGGTDGVTYKVTVQTSTEAGLLYEDEVTVIVEEI